MCLELSSLIAVGGFFVTTLSFTYTHTHTRILAHTFYNSNPFCCLHFGFILVAVFSMPDSFIAFVFHPVYLPAIFMYQQHIFSLMSLLFSVYFHFDSSLSLSFAILFLLAFCLCFVFFCVLYFLGFDKAVCVCVVLPKNTVQN